MFKQKKLSGGARFGLWAASAFLGFLLFVAALATALVANVRIITSQDGISGIIRTVMSAPAHVRPQAPITVGNEIGLRAAPRVRTNQMPRREEPEDVASGLTDQLIAMFYNELNTQFEEGFPVSQEEFTQMINESSVKDYVADKTAALITDYFNDEVTTTFEPEEVVALIHENSELIESVTGKPIPDDISQQVANIFNENAIIVKVEAEGLAGFMELMNGGEDESGVNGLTNMLGQVKDAFQKISKFTSVGILLLAIFLCLLLAAGIILVNCHQLGKGLRRTGYPLMLAGCMVFLNFAAKANPDMTGFMNLMSKLGMDDLGSTANLVVKMVRYILIKTTAPNAIFFFTGVALLIAGIVLPIILKAKGVATAVIASVTPETEAPIDPIAVAPVEADPIEVAPIAADPIVAEVPTEEITPINE